jgi:leucyl aminopeptidase
LARLVIKANLPLRLRLIVPCVENAVSGSAYRPGDILRSREGCSVEITNTDAEGRLILADALTAQVEDTPRLLIDFATLTGAGRVALGPDIPAVMSNNDELLNEAVETGKYLTDPIWPLPLYPYYRTYMESSLADIVNSSSQPYGGAITAGLFLQRFVPDHIPWLHFDLMAANLSDRPGRPKGGEAQALRAMLHLCEQHFKASAQVLESD